METSYPGIPRWARRNGRYIPSAVLGILFMAHEVRAVHRWGSREWPSGKPIHIQYWICRPTIGYTLT
jgi:hypothetical protein